MTRKEEADKFMNVMTPGVGEVLRLIDGQVSERISATSALYQVESRLRATVSNMDWESAGLLDNMPYDYSAERYLHPRERTMAFIARAISDTSTMFSLCKTIWDRERVPDEESFGEALIRSKHSMLAISRLPISQEDLLLAAIRIPERYKHVIDLTKQDSPVIIGKDKNGDKRFEWTENIEEWIKANTHTDRGCPANSSSIHDGTGHKHLFIYFFWDKMVEAAYHLADEDDIRALA